jgi:hypothetical protein
MEPHSVGGYNTGFQYKNDGLIRSAAYPEGNSVAYTYDSSSVFPLSDQSNLSNSSNPSDYFVFSARSFAL